VVTTRQRAASSTALRPVDAAEAALPSALVRAATITDQLAQRERLIRVSMERLRRGEPVPAPQGPAATELVEVALHRLMEQFLDEVHDAAAGATDPLTALWAATASYLDLPAGDAAGPEPVQRWSPLTWWAPQPWAAPGTATVTELLGRSERCFTTLLAATGVPAPEAVASAWVAALTGFQLRRSVFGHSGTAVLDELSRAFALPRPAATH